MWGPSSELRLSPASGVAVSWFVEEVIIAVSVNMDRNEDAKAVM